MLVEPSGRNHYSNKRVSNVTPLFRRIRSNLQAITYQRKCSVAVVHVTQTKVGRASLVSDYTPIEALYHKAIVPLTATGYAMLQRY